MACILWKWKYLYTNEYINEYENFFYRYMHSIEISAYTYLYFNNKKVVVGYRDELGSSNWRLENSIKKYVILRYGSGPVLKDGRKGKHCYFCSSESPLVVRDQERGHDSDMRQKSWLKLSKWEWNKQVLVGQTHHWTSWAVEQPALFTSRVWQGRGRT